MIVKTEDLTKAYQFGSSVILATKKASLEIEEASFVSIVGPSGSGKTTLMNLIGLVDYPTSGKVYFNGQDTSKLSEAERRRLRLSKIGLVFQTFNLIPSLTALENVELPMALAGLKPTAQRERATRLLGWVGLSQRLHHRPKELSTGEMQRVAIARALANNPSIIIADEPTGELDSATGLQIIDLLYNLCTREGKTVVVATHDEKMIRAADVKYTMRDGTVESML